MAESNMFGIRSPGVGGIDTPQRLVDAPDVVEGDVVARQLVGKDPVARALDVVLAAQRLTPTPGRPMLPVSMARLAMPMTIVEPWLCSVTPRP